MCIPIEHKIFIPVQKFDFNPVRSWEEVWVYWCLYYKVYCLGT